MWNALSVEIVMPGLMMCDQLSMMGDAREDASDIKRKADSLQEFTQMSLERVKKTVRQVCHPPFHLTAFTSQSEDFRIPDLTRLK